MGLPFARRSGRDAVPAHAGLSQHRARRSGCRYRNHRGCRRRHDGVHQADQRQAQQVPASQTDGLLRIRQRSHRLTHHRNRTHLACRTRRSSGRPPRQGSALSSARCHPHAPHRAARPWPHHRFSPLDGHRWRCRRANYCAHAPRPLRRQPPRGALVGGGAVGRIHAARSLDQRRRDASGPRPRGNRRRAPV